MLIKNDGETTPPLGSVGEIVGIEDETTKELLVEFRNYPCPAGPETAWICPEHWLVPLEPPSWGFYTDQETGLVEPLSLNHA
jgi:hypothetical protein